MDWADGCQVPVLSRRLRRWRIAIIADAARIDASSSSLLVDGGGSSPVDALRGWSWLHSGLARPSLRKGRGTAISKRPPEEEGGCELDVRGRGRPLETVVGDEDAACDIVGGRGCIWRGWGFRLFILMEPKQINGADDHALSEQRLW